jgi:hypothetical protein
VGDQGRLLEMELVHGHYARDVVVLLLAHVASRHLSLFMSDR